MFIAFALILGGYRPVSIVLCEPYVSVNVYCYNGKLKQNLIGRTNKGLPTLSPFE
jgi:hypothetical protein